MADNLFEAQLETLFGQPPAFGDSALFATRLQARLDRSWALRRVLITVAGLVGGALAVTQVVRSRALDQFNAVSRGWADETQRLVNSAPALSHAKAALAQTLPFTGDLLWPAAGLALLAAAFLSTRLLEER